MTPQDQERLKEEVRILRLSFSVDPFSMGAKQIGELFSAFDKVLALVKSLEGKASSQKSLIKDMGIECYKLETLVSLYREALEKEHHHVVTFEGGSQMEGNCPEDCHIRTALSAPALLAAQERRRKERDLLSRSAEELWCNCRYGNSCSKCQLVKEISALDQEGKTDG